ncbi:hypothetical protein KKH43_01985 [Patescibacteria group bacterium]|nr:hypothetical protein [Patescibacteria group bacterium]
MFKKVLLIVLIVSVVFVSSGLAILSQPKTAHAATWLTIDLDARLNKVLVMIWKFAIFPLVKKFVMKFATGDLSINGMEILTWFIKDLYFQSFQAVLLTYTGFSLCSDIKANVRVAFAKAGVPGTYKPECTFDRSLIKKSVDAMAAINKAGGVTPELLKQAEREFMNRFTIKLEGENNDLSTWFGIRSNASQQFQKSEQNYRFELLVNQGFFGARDCKNVNQQKTTKAQQAKTSKKVKKTATPKKPVDKYKDCRIKTPGLMFAEDAKKSIADLKKGTIQSVVLEDLVALTALFIDQVLETSVTGIWNSLSNAGTPDQKQEQTQGSGFDRSGQNRSIPIPQEQPAN